MLKILMKLSTSIQSIFFVIQNSFTKNIPIPHIANTAGEILHTIIQQCIKLTLESLGAPPARFVWLALGSQAKKRTTCIK